MKTTHLGAAFRRILLSTLLLGAIGSLSTPAAARAQEVPEDVLDALRWRNVGIARGGRSTAVAGSESRPFEYFFGATGGGLWKTTDGGNNWRPVTDRQIGSASVGAVAVCDADPDVVYIGTGETQLRGNIQQGDGAYKSVNGGRTWERIGLEATQNISRIRIHPENCDVAWVAAFGIHSAENPERGVFKTVDGGESWTHSLFKSPRAGAADLVLDPNNPDVIYASIWEAWRKSWGMSSGGPDSGLWKSEDGGESWMEITANLGLEPEMPVGKIGVAVSGANSNRVWAMVEHEPMGGVYRSEDGGGTWERVNEDRRLRQRAFYYTRIYADPADEEVVYVLNTGFYRSEDGGETFPRQISVPHGDNHDLWISPSDPERMINANDGGANVSFNGGGSWTDQRYMTAQFYRVITTNHDPYFICGAQQDNSTACMPSSGWNHLSAGGGFGGGGHFFSVGGCESGYIAPHPVDLDIYYAGCYGGSLSRYDHGTGLTRAIQVWPENPMGQSSEDLRERVQWTFPIVFNRFDPGVIYTGTQKVWRSMTEGQNWEQISDDLTRSDPATMGPSGGPVTKDQTGVETYATIFAIAPSYHDADVLWAGSDDGIVHISRDAASESPSWTDVTPPGAPDFTRINTIEASPTTPGKAYVAGIRYLVDNDRSPYIWKTEDYGASWLRITGGIPEDDFIRAVREDPMNPGLLYAASERTVYVSFNDGAWWQPLSLNLPAVQVSDLVVEDHDLVIGTHGRSFWVLPGLHILRQAQDALMETDGGDLAERTVLFDPKDPVRRIDNSAEVHYRLAEEADEVRIAFMDDAGSVLLEAVSRPAAGTDEEEDEEVEQPRRGPFGGGGGGGARPSRREGTNVFRWNMRHDGWTDFEGRIFWAAGNAGPAATPGSYSVELTVDGERYVQDFAILPNPRASAEGVTVEDLEERFEFAVRIRDRVTDANQSVIDIRQLKEQIEARMEESDDGRLKEMGSEVEGRLGGIEEEIYQVRNRSNQDPLNYPIKLNNKLAALLNHVEGSEHRPTDQSYAVFDALSEELDAQLEALAVVIADDLAALNELLEDLGLDPIVVNRPPIA
ncbi:MAG: glycosyl hydrolase [Gemmatimonadetes bacterium]|nr:glycosyl hydrolase [Gemmatimonadota bacterium]